jgi:hypothetical protein
MLFGSAFGAALAGSAAFTGRAFTDGGLATGVLAVVGFWGGLLDFTLALVAGVLITGFDAAFVGGLAIFFCAAALGAALPGFFCAFWVFFEGM